MMSLVEASTSMSAVESRSPSSSFAARSSREIAISPLAHRLQHLSRLPARRLCRREPGRPFAGEALSGPLARGVDAHLASERRKIRRVFEIVHRPYGELNVPLWIDVGACDPRGLTDVLHIDVLVKDDDRLREHELAKTPAGVHDLSRVARIPLIDRNQDNVVENSLWREMHVDD